MSGIVNKRAELFGTIELATEIEALRSPRRAGGAKSCSAEGFCQQSVPLALGTARHKTIGTIRSAHGLGLHLRHHLPEEKAAPQRRLRERTPDWRIIATAAPDDAASAAAVEPEFLFELLVRLFAGPALTYGLALEKLTGRPRAYGGTPAA